MPIRFSAILIIASLFAAVAAMSFAQGEWEFPDQQRNGIDTEASRLLSPDNEGIPIAQVTEKDLDEPEITEPPRVDNFPVVSADEAAKPRPRNPQRIFEIVDPSDFAAKLESDKLLLSEIRKDVPEAVEEARMYLDRLKFLAGKSDPERLVPLVNRVLDQAPIYFDWLERDFETQEEQVTEYYVGGARGFNFAIENFRSAVFFVIMNRLDVAARVISELDNENPQ
ncbi:MAG: hypothetical protein HN368_20665 [Spirochaetales bacterium]|nr:hypothetical protein [Spirochaetales bacterium]